MLPTVFANSEVQKSYSEKKINLFYKDLLQREEWMLQVILADSAHPLLPYVLKSMVHAALMRKLYLQWNLYKAGTTGAWKSVRFIEILPENEYLVEI